MTTVQEGAVNLSAASVYTTIAPERVMEVERGDDPSEFLFEKKRWVTAERLFLKAKEQGLTFPVLLSDARDCAALVFWGQIREMKVTDDGTHFRFSHLRGLRDRVTQDLLLLKERRNIAPGFIRPYAVVSTPDFLESHGMDADERWKLVEATPGISRLPGRASEAPTEPLTLFSWGYYLWGSSLPELFSATATVERSRGFEPPLFVDVRFSRSVRAKGFRERAMEKALPAGRYLWMKGLGNEAIGAGFGGWRSPKSEDGDH